MSGLAEILLREGFTVTGSDAHETELTNHLEAAGAQIFYGQRAENISDSVRLVVYTAAVHSDNPEYAAAMQRGLPMLSRAELLGQDDEKLQTGCGCGRNSWKDNNYLDADRDSSGSRDRSNDFRRRNSSFYRRKYPGGGLRAVCDRGL